MQWQIAENGNWETAITITPGDDTQASLDWAEKAAQDIAIEAFFESPDDKISFFGTRLSCYNKEEQKDILKNLMQKATPKADFKTVLQHFITTLDLKNIFSNPPDFLEIGVEGLWKSFGSQVIWNHETQNLQSVSPHLMEPAPRPIMLEIAWKKPLPLWLALQISEQENDRYRFCNTLYHTVLNDLSLSF